MIAFARKHPVAMLASCVLVGVAAFYLLTEHLQHTLGALPYVILLACPLLHFFMHRGHDHGRSRDEGAPRPPDDPPAGGHHAR